MGMGMIKNKKIKKKFVYHKIFTCGIKLTPSEIISINANKVDISGAECVVKDDKLILTDCDITSTYTQYSINFPINKDKPDLKYGYHEPKRNRELIISKKELRYITNYMKKFDTKTKKNKVKIVPISLFMNERNWIKINIGIVKDIEFYDNRGKVKNLKEVKDKKTLDYTKEL